MPGMAAIQVKHVPEDLHAAARERAAQRGQSLGEYLLELLRRDLQRPRWEAWAEAHPPLARRGVDGAALQRSLAAAREDRERELDDRADASLGRPEGG